MYAYEDICKDILAQ